MSNQIFLKRCNVNHKNPEIGETPNGHLAASFRVAENQRDFKGEEKTIWYTVQAYKGKAKRVRDNVGPGDLLQIDGEFTINEDKNGNVYPTIVADRVVKLDPMQVRQDSEEDDEDEDEA